MLTSPKGVLWDEKTSPHGGMNVKKPWGTKPHDSGMEPDFFPKNCYNSFIFVISYYLPTVCVRGAFNAWSLTVAVTFQCGWCSHFCRGPWSFQASFAQSAVGGGCSPQMSVCSGPGWWWEMVNRRPYLLSLGLFCLCPQSKGSWRVLPPPPHSSRWKSRQLYCSRRNGCPKGWLDR